MVTKIEKFIQSQSKKDLPDIHAGDTVRVSQKIQSFDVGKKRKDKEKDKDKEKIQVFEGLVIAIKHGKELGGTFTVRKIVSEVGVEKIFPIHSPSIEKIEIKQRGKVRRGKLYYLRTAKEKKAKLKKKKIKETIVNPASVQISSDATPKKEITEDKALPNVLQDKNSENKENTEKKN